MAAGCNAFLPKPVDLDELLALLENYLQLKWIYEENQPTLTAADSRESILVSPPVDALTSLKHFVTIGDISGVGQQLDAIEAMGSQYHGGTGQIRRLAKQFQINAIQKFLKQYRQDQ